MDVNFLVRAALTGCLLVAITRAGPATPSRGMGGVLLAIWAGCSALLPFFPTDVVRAGRRQASVVTVHGSIHLALAGIGFLAALAGVIVLTRWLRQGAVVNGAAAASVLAAVAAIGMVAIVISVRARPGVFGLSERVFIGAILAWSVVVAIRLRSRGAAVYRTFAAISVRYWPPSRWMRPIAS